LWGKIGSFVVLVILLAGLLFSYSRAAWISLVVAILVFVTVILRIRARIIFLGLGILVIALMMAGKNILMKMEKNNQDSSNNLAEHVQSISNISTDASNLERLNRWSCALRMWVKKPLFGWGPGTYMFQYAPFQKESQKTIISTNYGDAGNAHSEYLGPLSEMGLPGGLAMLAIVVVSFITAMRVYKNETIPEMKMLSLVLLLGLVTYFLHGVMNDFLDTDKASAGVWGFMAVLVALDLKRSETKKTTP
ncbi:MAG: O-antigen ligase family protein, partial [Bacteroidales bacterium]|nr:O-antigen ligase family protein [Bacteroidales bacterium]